MANGFIQDTLMSNYHRYSVFAFLFRRVKKFHFDFSSVVNADINLFLFGRRIFNSYLEQKLSWSFSWCFTSCARKHNLWAKFLSPVSFEFRMFFFHLVFCVIIKEQRCTHPSTSSKGRKLMFTLTVKTRPFSSYVVQQHTQWGELATSAACRVLLFWPIKACYLGSLSLVPTVFAIGPPRFFFFVPSVFGSLRLPEMKSEIITGWRRS